MKNGVIEGVEYGEGEVFKAAKLFMETQGIVPAPESAHAIAAVIDEALAAKARKEKKVIVFNLSGHGLLDLTNYESMMRRWKDENV